MIYSNDCADLCTTLARMLARTTEFNALLVKSLVDACALACGACAEECDRHAAHIEACRIARACCREVMARCSQVFDS